MKYFTALALLVALLVALVTGGCATKGQDSASSAAPAVDPAFESAARGATNRLRVELKTELKAAMKSGGPVEAISVCNERAYELGREISEASGLEVRRVSNRRRNAASAPDSIEAVILEVFRTRPALDDTVLVQADVPIYMRAIRIDSPACLKCHGQPESFDTALTARLAELYPEDRATGFALGDLRGAFVVR